MRLVFPVAVGALCNRSAPFANDHNAIVDSVLVTFILLFFVSP